ncbi:uncharacterized protein LOC108912509 [Anoplophora glabripennis]|uniref:uncharacterized protein LOC108912509 n=1 Tax=Anoplophora glabripennis TaxID=217634 RepID=UPI000C761B8A|nr:uncharacterized protein LOC108912509 [Anoplophora glabripennis]
MATSQLYEIILHDPKRQVDYTIQLNHEEYLRAQREFANRLLLHARDNSTEQQDHETNDSSLDNEHEKENTKSVINVWNYNQTKCLIQSMGTHINDLNHPKKRKYDFDHIVNDLLSNGYKVDAQMVQNKWRSLVRSYNKAKDNKNRTGCGPTRILFYDIIDEILGDKPSNNCTHSLNSIENITAQESQETSVEMSPTNILSTQAINAPAASSYNVGESGLVNNMQNLKPKKKLSVKNVQREYLEIKKEEYTNKQKRHDEKCCRSRNKSSCEK